ncbi:MAG: hypothetical protein Fues2KO_27470 [Fuerstiella sp.]
MVVVSVMITADAAFGQSDGGRTLEQAKILWARILAEDPKIRTALPKGSSAYWEEIHESQQPQFDTLLEGSELTTALDYLASRFKSDDGGSNMRWMYFMRRADMEPFRINLLPKGEQPLKFTFAESLVRHFLVEKELVAEYYRFLIYEDRAFSKWRFQGHLRRTVDGMSASDVGEAAYWWTGFKFLVLAHGTGRDDLVRKATPENLKSHCRVWAEWLRTDGPFLRPAPDYWNWVVDEGEKDRLERFLPFVQGLVLPPLKRKPETPFTIWQFDAVPDPELLPN